MKPPTFGKTAVESETVFDTVFVFSGEGTQDFDSELRRVPPASTSLTNVPHSGEGVVPHLCALP